MDVPEKLDEFVEKRRREKAIQQLEEIQCMTIKVEQLVCLLNDTEKCAPIIKEFIEILKTCF